MKLQVLGFLLALGIITSALRVHLRERDSGFGFVKLVTATATAGSAPESTCATATCPVVTSLIYEPSTTAPNGQLTNCPSCATAPAPVTVTMATLRREGCYRDEVPFVAVNVLGCNPRPCESTRYAAVPACTAAEEGAAETCASAGETLTSTQTAFVFDTVTETTTVTEYGYGETASWDSTTTNTVTLAGTVTATNTGFPTIMLPPASASDSATGFNPETDTSTSTESPSSSSSSGAPPADR